MQIIMKKISELKHYEKNNKKHPEKQIDKIVASIKEFSFKNPVLIDKDNVIIAGHGRTIAAEKVGMIEVPCIDCSDLNTKQVKALRLMDNKSADLAEWDFDNIKFELDFLQSEGYNLDFTGFDMAEFEEEKEVQEDDFDVEEQYKKPVMSKLGDIWLLGRHRLMCGDSTDKATVEKLMDGKKADMLLTDPPYNVSYQGGTKEKLTILNDKMDNNSFREFLKNAFMASDNVLKEGGVFYIWHADLEGYNFRGACLDIGWKVRQCLIWNKSSLIMGRQDYHWKHEPCLYGWKDGASHLWATDRKQTTVIDYQKPNRNGEHPTMKPIGLFDYQIKNNTKGQDIVLDLFGGSGTTIIACEQNGRCGYSMELDEKYVDVIVNRYKEFVGSAEDIKCIRNGETYNYADIFHE